MTIEIIISKIEELLGYSNVKFDKEVNDNYFLQPRIIKIKMYILDEIMMVKFLLR